MENFEFLTRHLLLSHKITKNSKSNGVFIKECLVEGGGSVTLICPEKKTKKCLRKCTSPGNP